MAKGFKHGAGGGAPLNFKVVGGASAPASPKANDIWVNTDVAISRWDFSATEPQRRSNNKNLIVHPYDNSDTTISGITFKPFTGGTVGVSGTASAQATFYLNDKKPLLLPTGTYTFSGAMEGGGSSTWVVGLKYSYDDFKTPVYSTTGTSQTITFDKPVKVIMYLQVKSGVTASGNFKPQIEKGSSATSFIKGDATGQVWITTGKSSTAPFNALKKNNITVYPISAKQYVSGAWVDKTAKIYQGGAWANWWNGELYENGNQFTNITGGWAVHDYVTDSKPLMAAEHKADQMFFQAQNDYKVLLGIGNPIDLSDKTKIRVTGKMNVPFVYNSTTYGLYMDVLKTKDCGTKVAGQAMLVAGMFDYTLDVSNLTGEHYLIIWAFSNANINGYITGVYVS